MSYRHACCKLATVVIAALTIGACTAPTKMKSTWQDPTFEKAPFNSVAVLALMEDEASSRAFEQQAARALRADGLEVVEGRASLDMGGDLTYEQMESKLKQNGTEGILIFKLIAVDSDYTFHPPTPFSLGAQSTAVHPRYSYYYPTTYYYPYWRAGLQVTGNPGYWTEREFYVIESALYDNASDRLVWIATSRTYAPAETQELSQSLLKVVSERLSEENLIAARQ